MVGNDPKWIIVFQEKPHTQINPGMAFTLEDGRFYAALRGDDDDGLANAGSSNYKDYDYIVERTILAQVTYNQWYSIEYEVFHDYRTVGNGGNGYFICRLDEVEKINESDVQTFFKDSNIGGIHTTIGLYEFFSASSNEENAIHFRNIEIWDMTGVI